VRSEEVRERVGERYKRETLMGLAQTELAQSEAVVSDRSGPLSDDLSRLIDDKLDDQVSDRSDRIGVPNRVLGTDKDD
jgi:hypothetical protein